MELLSPAGSKEALKAAILGGTDAIYLGGKHFGARRLAENFTDSELKAAVKLAHSSGVKVYVTVNILVKEKELPQAFSHVDYLNSLDIDAVIIQDRGLLKLIRENYSIPIHASTQMGIHSVEGAAWAEKNGISRIILARELHIDEIKKIRKATKIELEVFGHGALCYSFSGKCFFSSMLGGRSGNRGMCAQPCRKPYTIKDKCKYWLSTADIALVDALPDLIRLGIDALKIEGRMRSPIYTYLTSKVYSSAIKKAKQGKKMLVNHRERELLEVVFNRGFTKGYLLEKNVMQREYPQSRGLFLGNAHFDGKRLTVKSKNLRIGDGITLYRNHEKIGGFEIKYFKGKKDCLILRLPFKIPDGEYQVYKTKDSEFDSIRKIIDSIHFTSSSKKGKKRNPNFSLATAQRDRTKGELSFYLSSLKSLKSVLPYANRVYFELNKHFNDAAVICNSEGVEYVVMMPRIAFDTPEFDADNIMISSIDQFEKYVNRKLYGHYSMNFFNSLTIPKLFQYTLSVELSKEDIKEITLHYSGRLEMIVFGRIELMVTRDVTLEEGLLVNQKRKKFPVFRDRLGLTHVINSSNLFLLDFLGELEDLGINSFGIDLRRRSPEFSKIVAKAFYERDVNSKNEIKKKCGSMTSGRFLRGVA